jgi:hypothetical protein
MAERRMRYRLMAEAMVAGAEAGKVLMGMLAAWVSAIGNAITPEQHDTVMDLIGLEIIKTRSEIARWSKLAMENKDVDVSCLLDYVDKIPLDRLMEIARINAKVKHYKAYEYMLEDLQPKGREDSDLYEQAQEAVGLYESLVWFRSVYGHVSTQADPNLDPKSYTVRSVDGSGITTDTAGLILLTGDGGRHNVCISPDNQIPSGAINWKNEC